MRGLECGFNLKANVIIAAMKRRRAPARADDDQDNISMARAGPHVGRRGSLDSSALKPALKIALDAPSGIRAIILTIADEDPHDAAV